MNPNNQTIPDDEIDLKEITLTLWKEKYLILIITLVFTVAGYVYGTLQPKVYQTVITIREAPNTIVENYYLFHNNKKKKLVSDYKEEFKSSLMSGDHLKNFLKQSEKFKKFNSDIKINQIKLLKNKQNIKFYNLAFTFSKPSLGENFLNNYVIYTKQIADNKLHEYLTTIIENQIQIYNQNIELAKAINLENPHPQLRVSKGDPATLFYQGTKILILQKHGFEQMMKQKEKFTINYNPIVDQNLAPNLISKQPFIYMVLSFFIGLFFSLITIYIRSTLLR